MTAIWHDDLNLDNILVDNEGKIIAIVNWECVPALPTWMATKMPKFLEGGGRQEEPKREDYQSDETPEGPGDLLPQRMMGARMIWTMMARTNCIESI